MKAISYLWIILVGSTFSIPFFEMVQQKLDIPESGWPGGAIKIAFIGVGLLLTILAINKIKEVDPSDYAMVVEYPENRWVGHPVDWRIIGEREDGYSMVRCRLTDSSKPARVFLIRMPGYLTIEDSGTGTLTVGGNDSQVYYEIGEDYSTSRC